MNDWVKVLIVPVAGILILIAAYAVIIKPQDTKIEEMNEQLDILLGGCCPVETWRSRLTARTPGAIKRISAKEDAVAIRFLFIADYE